MLLQTLRVATFSQWGRLGDWETGRLGDSDTGRVLIPFPNSHYPLPITQSPFPIPHSLIPCQPLLSIQPLHGVKHKQV
jgi:hypothetical protein